MKQLMMQMQIMIMMRCYPNATISKIEVVTADENQVESQANQDALTVVQDGTDVAVAINGVLNSFTSTNPAQGTGKWIGFEVATGAADLTKVKYNGVALTAADVAEANNINLPTGSFALWVKAGQLPKTFTVEVDGVTMAYTLRLA